MKVWMVIYCSEYNRKWYGTGELYKEERLAKMKLELDEAQNICLIQRIVSFDLPDATEPPAASETGTDAPADETGLTP